MVSAARQRITPYEYFRNEQESAQKHEYLDGQVWTMAGGTPDHSRVITNIIIALGGQLMGSGDGWSRQEYRQGSAPLSSIACELGFDDVYRNRLLPR